MLLIKRMFRILKPYWLMFLGAFLSLILSSVANLYSPMLLKQVLDDGINGRNLDVVYWGAGGNDCFGIGSWGIWIYPELLVRKNVAVLRVRRPQYTV